jgi:hypothetical protein
LKIGGDFVEDQGRLEPLMVKVGLYWLLEEEGLSEGT